MKIDESCINHNVARLVRDMVTDAWDVSNENDTEDHARIMMLGYISGVTELGEALKKILGA